MSAFLELPIFKGLDYRQALRALAALSLLVIAVAARAQTPQFTSEVEARVLALTNDLRAKSGVPPLQGEARLGDAARGFAAYVAGTGNLEHDADGSTPADRVKKRGYDYCTVAENLGSQYDSAGFTQERLSESFMRGWMESPTHRDNILSPEVTQIGIGVARSRSGEYFAVQVFARPLAQMTRFRITNRANATVRYEYRRRSVTLGPKQGRNHESCISGTLKLDSSGQDVLLEPKDGGRYAIVEGARGVYRITPE